MKSLQVILVSFNFKHTRHKLQPFGEYRFHEYSRCILCHIPWKRFFEILSMNVLCRKTKVYIRCSIIYIIYVSLYYHISTLQPRWTLSISVSWKVVPYMNWTPADSHIKELEQVDYFQKFKSFSEILNQHKIWYHLDEFDNQNI